MTKQRLGSKEPYVRLYASVKDHPRHRQAGLAAEGLWKRAMGYCAEYLTDGVIPGEWLEGQAPKKTVQAGVDAGLFSKIGDSYLVNDFLDHNRSRAQVEENQEWGRNRKALHRDRELVAAVRLRDKDECRYCAVAVNWTDKRGPVGGTYDLVSPGGPNTLENVVVACRRCNTVKNARTPDEAGMALRELGSDSSLDSTPESTRSRNGVGSDLKPDLILDSNVPRVAVTQLEDVGVQT